MNNDNRINLCEPQPGEHFNEAADNGVPVAPQEHPCAESPGKVNLTGFWTIPLTIERNNFVNKSLSSWACNVAVGCVHGCLFCYVAEIVMKLKKKLATFGVTDPDGEWGLYAFYRAWDEFKFLLSLDAAERTPLCALNKDGNRAIMFCTTTDPYQTVRHEDPVKQKLLNEHGRLIVRRSLELILTESTMNVRILTRSPLARRDFDLYKQLGNRLLFGTSIPTLDNELARIYEPNAPAPTQRLKTLQAAKAAGIPLFVAVAPTYPECDETDLRRTLAEVARLDPVTVFAEPINLRADNVARIRAHAASIGKTTNLDVFATRTAWFRYSMQQLLLVQRIAREVGLEHCLHLWPDPDLKARSIFLEVRRVERAEAHPGVSWTERDQARHQELDEAAYAAHLAWLHAWWSRISEWPGKPVDETWSVPDHEVVPLEAIEAAM